MMWRAFKRETVAMDVTEAAFGRHTEKSVQLLLHVYKAFISSQLFK